MRKDTKELEQLMNYLSKKIQEVTLQMLQLLRKMKSNMSG